jgi:hypothetical protein
VGGEWTTVVVFNNTNDLPVQFPVSFLNKDGPWPVSIKGLGTFSTYNVSLAAKGSQRIELTYSGSDTLVGFAITNVPCGDQLCGGVGGYVLLRNHNAKRQQDFEVSYQLTDGFASSPQEFLFDQSNFAQMVLNLTNTCVDSFCGSSTVTIEIFDENGQRFYLDTFDMNAAEVKIMNFAQISMDTWNKVGMVRLTGANQIVVSGHRINETGSFTPITAYGY